MGSGFSRDPIGTIPSVPFDPRAAVFITLATNIVLTLLSGKHISWPTATCLHQWSPHSWPYLVDFSNDTGKNGTWDIKNIQYSNRIDVSTCSVLWPTLEINHSQSRVRRNILYFHCRVLDICHKKGVWPRLLQFRCCCGEYKILMDTLNAEVLIFLAGLFCCTNPGSCKHRVYSISGATQFKWFQGYRSNFDCGTNGSWYHNRSCTECHGGICDTIRTQRIRYWARGSRCMLGKFGSKALLLDRVGKPRMHISSICNRE